MIAQDSLEKRMEMNRASLIGLGALGVMFGNQLNNNMKKGSFRIIADESRLARYSESGIYCNGRRCEFVYQNPGSETDPADLAIFAVKYSGLKDAIKSMKNQISENTVIISLLNGISSETILADAFGPERIIYCVAQGMDAVKEGNQILYQNIGMLVIGEKNGKPSKRAVELSGFLKTHGVPCIVEDDMYRKIWSKFMLNVGVNQVVALYGGTYGEIQEEGASRDLMKEAMREVIRISAKEGVGLAEDDLEYWMKVLATLSPDGKPSMRQDIEAKRPSELELFSGTVLEFAEKHGLSVPVNKMIYEKIKEIERSY